MFSSQQYRAKAAEYSELGKKSDAPNEIREFRELESSYTVLADNEDWLKLNHDKAVQSPDEEQKAGRALATEEKHILRCLGAAVIMQWNKIPKKLQRELFDTAGSLGDLPTPTELRAQIARFLHKHKDDES
jgi:hypothetical protein